MIRKKEGEKMTRLIPIGYLGSIILFLSSIVYFFAANWGYFSRYEKLSLSVGAMILFYLVSFTSTKLLSHQPFLGKWFLVAAAICFGVSVGLVGQIYNSHADSYMLFVVWLLPTVLLAFITRYTPLWILSYILFHLAYWFYMYPSSYFIVRSNFEEWVIYLAIGVINLFLFGLTFTSSYNIKTIRYLSYSVVHLSLIGISFFELFDPYSGWTNILYIFFAFISYRLLTKNSGDKGLTIILFTMGSLYAFAKIIELPILFLDNLGFFAIQLSGSIASIILIICGVLLARKITRNAGDGVNNIPKRILIVIVTIFGSIIFASSFGSLIFLIFESEYAIVTVSLIFILVGLLFHKLEATARHTLIIMAFFSGMLAAIFLSSFITILYLVISLVTFLLIKDGVVRLISYTSFMGCTLSLLLNELELSAHLELILLTFAIGNGVLTYLAKNRKDVSRIGLFYSLLFLYSLTFLNEGLLIEIFYSVLFFGVGTIVLLDYGRNEKLFEFRLTVVFWLAFLITTYYDFVWSLLHKSLSLFIIGLLFLLLTRFFDKKESGSSLRTVFSKKQWYLITSVVLLQLSILGYQVFSNEQLLSEGKVITLELAPVDPRSLIQGDYVRLQYEIGELELPVERNQGRAYLLLKENKDGIYQTIKVFNRQIDPTKMKLAEDEVIMTGKYNGYDQIIFGIESYFVPEGTGLDVERNAKLAKVAVSKKGDSILLSVE